MGSILHFGRRTPVPLPALPGRPKSLVHTLALALVALTVGAGAVVFSEPAPVDALTIMLIVLLPVIGLVAIRPALVVFLSGWLVIGGCAVFASMLATDAAQATTHTAVSIYLYLAAFTFAAFIAKSPTTHTRLVLDAYQVAAWLAAAAGIAGYFDVVPGASDLFTKFGRASGPFKDPNVFGAFLVLAVVYELHLAVTKRGMAGAFNLAAMGFLTLGVLVSFSRGAWMTTAIAVLVYGYLTLVTAKQNRERLKLVGIAVTGALSAVFILAAAMQSDGFASLMEERAALTQGYDEGPDGRFGGHEKAQELALENPLGIGAREFATHHHPEDVHNVYISMFLNAGWLGGLLYAAMTLMTAVLGLRHAFRRTATQPLFIVAYAALLATLLLGLLIDSDHWRHFYLLMGITWGLMTGDRRVLRTPRIVADLRPLLLQRTIVVAPARRASRIVRAVPRLVPPRHRPGRPRRPARIVA